ncbi:hypothetical protein MMC09_000444 [Bachmanniomyces sp. S44760]|nr:hypothetical protein [Bachmanniomyces sp. S44760]
MLAVAESAHDFGPYQTSELLQRKRHELADPHFSSEWIRRRSGLQDKLRFRRPSLNDSGYRRVCTMIVREISAISPFGLLFHACDANGGKSTQRRQAGEIIWRDVKVALRRMEAGGKRKWG